MSHRDYLLSLEQFGIKLGLAQVRALVAALGHPDRAFPSVLVAGTNGKGSVTAMIDRGLRAAGHRTGRYVSPHLVALNERFVVDGAAIDDAALDALAGVVRHAATALPWPPSFFEATTALALEWFRRQAVDVAVLEVGLGGRLDATNVVTPAVAVITAIDLDHQAHLGHSIREIAAEKAGIVKPGIDVVLAPNPPDAVEVVADACAREGAALHRVSGIEVDTNGATPDGRSRVDLMTPAGAYRNVTLSLRGRHQVENAATALRALEVIDGRGTARVPADARRTALEATTWPARLQLVTWRGCELLIDGAHNPAGARALAAFITETWAARRPLVVGVMADKDLDGIVRALATVASRFVFTAARSPRSAQPALLIDVAARVAPEVPAAIGGSPMEAIAEAGREAPMVVVAGSLYLAGEVLANLS